VAGDRPALSLPDVRSLVGRLAWPVIGEQLLQTLVGVVDMALVGRLGPSAVAGVGTANQLLQVAISALGAVSVGTTVLVARATGAREPRHAGLVTAQSLLAGLVLGIVLVFAGFGLARPLIQMLGPEASVVDLGVEYLQIVSISLPALVMMLVAGGALRGTGDTRTPLTASALMNVVNVVLAYALVFGHLGLPALGVGGSALAAGIARLCGAVFLLILLFRPGRVMVARSHWLPDPQVVRRVLSIGIPTAIEQTMLSAGFLLYGAMVITLGTSVYATQRITFQAINLAFMPAFGYATAATTLVGQSLGARHPEAAQAATRSALRQALFWMTLAGVVFAVFGRPMMYLFSDDPEVISLGAIALPVLAIAQPFWAIGQVYAGSLRGAGDARFPMMATSLGMWLVRLPSAYFCGIVLGWGLPGVYLSSTFDSALRALLNYLRYRSGRWQRIEL
jgi:putative MATE family efflux protein